MEEKKISTSFTKWKPIEIMLAVLFLIAPFYYHPNIGGEGLRIPNNITVWIVATTVIWYSVYRVLKSPTVVLPQQFAYFAAFPILVTLSGFLAGVDQPLVWLFRLLYVWGGLAFFFSLFQHGLKQGRIDRLLFIIVLSALMHSLAGIAQIWLASEVPFWLPISRSGAPSGFFQQINNQAIYQVTAMMIAGYLTTRPLIIHGVKWMMIIIVLMMANASFIVITSNSTIGILTLIVGSILLLPILWQRFNRNKRLFICTLVALIIGSSAGLKVKNDNRMDETVALQTGYAGVIDKTKAMQSGYSGSARLGIYSISIDLIKQKPLFGHGIGSFPSVWQYAKPDFYQSHPSAALPYELVGHPHNEIIFWLVEGGIITAIGLIAAIIGSLLALTRLGWQRGMAYLAMLIPIVLHIQIELPFYTSVTHWFLFLMFLFGISNHKLITCKNKSSVVMNTFLKGLNVTAFSLSSLFLMHTILSSIDFMNTKTDKNPLQYAKSNPYFRSDIEWINMGSLMYSSMASNNLESVHYAANLVEKYALHKPSRHVFYVLLDAYEYLRLKDRYCDIANKHQAMYPYDRTLHPDDPRLQQAQKRCF